MKIWEIEEGKVFKEIGNPHNLYKIVGMELHIWDDKYSQFRWDDIEYNDVVFKDYEYAPEKEYCLVMKPEMRHLDDYKYLNYCITEKEFWFSDYGDTETTRTSFTETEIDKLIPPLYLKICDKIEVEDE